MRGFSLIEVSITVAILGVAAALAVPSLLPIIHRAQLDGGTETAANLMARARAEAMYSKRCVRVRVVSNALEVDRLNSFDCENPGTAPLIDTGAGTWINIERVLPESPSVTFALTDDPADTPGELRIRPNGRSYSVDGAVAGDYTNDDALFTVTHALEPAGGNHRQILYNGNGLVCALRRGISLAGPDYNCP
ncbi:MAG: prepilin-type N-terminal cleavage/methylation domain-containing protein [Deltaproteobacteria bacterium]|nr:prepilin-type N-terminal cleavage/methylation domain-containing protein [Deltaproteobacteria bacterium]